MCVFLHPEVWPLSPRGNLSHCSWMKFQCVQSSLCFSEFSPISPSLLFSSKEPSRVPVKPRGHRRVQRGNPVTTFVNTCHFLSIWESSEGIFHWAIRKWPVWLLGSQALPVATNKESFCDVSRISNPLTLEIRLSNVLLQSLPRRSLCLRVRVSFAIESNHLGPVWSLKGREGNGGRGQTLEGQDQILWTASFLAPSSYTLS